VNDDTSHSSIQFVRISIANPLPHSGGESAGLAYGLQMARSGGKPSALAFEPGAVHNLGQFSVASFY